MATKVKVVRLHVAAEKQLSTRSTTNEAVTEKKKHAQTAEIVALPLKKFEQDAQAETYRGTAKSEQDTPREYKKKKSLPGRIILVFAGFVLLGVSGLRFVKLSSAVSSADLAQIQLSTPNHFEAGKSATTLFGRQIALAELPGGLTRPNPSLSFFERVFCRGRKVSRFCSGKNYHPYLQWWEDWSKDEGVADEVFDRAKTQIQNTFSKP